MQGLKVKIFLIGCIAVQSFPLKAFSATVPPPPGGGSTVPPPTGGGSSVGLTNPLKSPTLMGFLQELLDVIMVFAIPLIVFMIIYAGFMYVTAQGDAGKVKTAHHALLYAVIGGVIILGANVILAVIEGTVDAFR
jgi:hypothetical protein